MGILYKRFIIGASSGVGLLCNYVTKSLNIINILRGSIQINTEILRVMKIIMNVYYIPFYSVIKQEMNLCSECVLLIFIL